MLTILLALAAVAPGGVSSTVEVDVTGLRNARGLIQVCVTQDRAHFPDCRKDPAARKQSVAASKPQFQLTGLAPGRYAITLFHDENSNRKLDTALGIPKEGFGFSRNPKIRFGAPKFDTVVMEVPAGITRTTIRLQYML